MVELKTPSYTVYDGNQIVLQIEAEGQVTNRYLWGPAVDQILADEQVQFDGSSAILWTLTDHLNTVRDLVVRNAETGVTTIANHVVYDAFGRVTDQTSPTVTTLFGFTARPFDADTGLQNNLNRWYDAETGTWISEDPKGFAAADPNLYRYVGNEPLQLADPLGLLVKRAVYTVIVWANGEMAREAKLNDELTQLRIKLANQSANPFALADTLNNINIEQKRLGVADMQMLAEANSEFIATAASMGMTSFKVGGFSALGRKQLIGTTFRTEIVFLGRAATEEASLARALSALEREAVAAGAKELQIVGVGVRKAFSSASLAEKYGYTVRVIDKNTVVWIKKL